MMRGRTAGAEGLSPVSTSFGDPFSAAKHSVRKPAWLGAQIALTFADLGGGSRPALPPTRAAGRRVLGPQRGLYSPCHSSADLRLVNRLLQIATDDP